MNKQRIHDILSSIQMSPRDKKDLVNAIVNSGGINESTPIKESIDGIELVPIFDGENKAVSVNELIKGGKEVYFLDIDNYKTSEDYDNLKAAVDLNKLIISQGAVFSLAELPNGSLMGVTHAIIGAADDSVQLQINSITYLFGADGQIIKADTEFALYGNGDGTKFLSDDGTYKEIDIASLQTQITALEERIAALEGTTA